MLAAPPVGRRAAMRAICGHCIGLAGLVAGQPARAQAPAANQPSKAPLLPPEQAAQVPRFERPALDTDEGGLWSLMDREETRLRRSPFVLRDKALNDYLQDLVCRLNPIHCADIRVHVVRTPVFNANMAPNGMMQVWSGLLLRAENEAQLAAVLGHELGHYLERHTLEQLRDLKGRAAAATVMAMFGVVGLIGQLGTMSGAFAFSREHETRADRLGMYMMQRAGYDGREAARVWENLIAELKVTGGEEAGKKSPMFATHPPAADRRDELLRLAGGAGGRTGAAEFAQVIAPMRLAWLQDEIKRGQYEESLVLFGRMLQQRADDAEVLYARAEVYRQRAAENDLAQAVGDLQRASALERAPAETWRALGLIHRQRAEPALARAAFEKYLALAPQAADSGLIKSYVSELAP